MIRGPTPRSDQYQFEELAPGIVGAVARAEGTALSNGGIVNLGGATLVFDTGLTLRAARDLHAAAERLTGRPPAFAANSHWHLDHLLGNQLFAAHPIHATRRTVEILLEKRVELEGELTPAKLEAELRELEGEARGHADPTPSERAEYELAVRINRTLRDEAPELRLTIPSKPFDSELRLPGERNARLVTFGSGHTESDAVLELPDERIVFAGDLVVAGHHPNLLSGDPRHWLVVLDEIERLAPERVVTGHGPVGTRETIAEMRDYLSMILREAENTGSARLPDRFARWSGRSQFDRNVAFVRSLR
jgi:cyclase